MYNPLMPEYRFYYPIEVRYADLDPQGHVNNAKYLTYLEQARIAYFQQLGLWNSDSFMDMGVILADLHIAYKASIYFGQLILVGLSITHLGNKSMKMECHIIDKENGFELASCSTVLVTYDYHLLKSIPIPEEWRKKISAFENLPVGETASN